MFYWDGLQLVETKISLFSHTLASRYDNMVDTLRVVTTAVELALIIGLAYYGFQSTLVPVAQSDIQKCEASQCTAFVEDAVSYTSSWFIRMLIAAAVCIFGLLVYIIYASCESDKEINNTTDALSQLKSTLVEHINKHQSFYFVDIKKFDTWFRATPHSTCNHFIERPKEIPFSMFVSEKIVTNMPLQGRMPSTYYCLLLLVLRHGIPVSSSASTSVQIAPATV